MSFERPQMPDEQGSTSETTTLKFSGKKQYLPRSGSNFFSEMKELCSRAGLLGTVSLVVLHNFSDVISREGIHIHTPSQRGVQITWHSSDKESIRVMLSGYKGLPVDELHRRLTDAYPNKQTEEGKRMARQKEPPDTSSTLSKILGGAINNPDESSGSAQEEPTVDISASGKQASEETPLSKFLNDEDRVNLFFLDLVPQANDRGEVSTRVCVELLRSEFDFPKVEYANTETRSAYNQPYNALSSLVKKGQLEKISFGYRISTDILARLRESQRVGDTTPEEDAPMETQTPGAGNSAPEENLITPESASGMPSPSDLLQHIEALANRVGQNNALRERLKEIDTQREILNAEKQTIVGKLKDPRVKEDEEAYRAIMRISKI